MPPQQLLEQLPKPASMVLSSALSDQHATDYAVVADTSAIMTVVRDAHRRLGVVRRDP